MAEKTIDINFEGYWREGTLGHIPPRSGVFCVYECALSGGEFPEIRRLLFIGQTADAQEEIAKHEDWDSWNEAIADDSHLCFSFAHVPNEDRERVHAALLYEFSPALNRPYVNIYGIGRPATDEVRFFPFDRTTLQISGIREFLKEHIEVEREEE